MSRIESMWYSRPSAGVLLAPLAGVYCAVVGVRRWLYRTPLLRSERLPVPVIVIGNITVGGTGKTPLVVWMVEHLRRRGFHPGIVSRGYGGRAQSWPQSVRPDSDPRLVGDEPVLLARRCGCPVAVGPDRVAAARALIEQGGCDAIVSDDGLQHYALARDIEIAVIDGERRLGNGLCLPAGPLREPRSRLDRVDLVVVNGAAGQGEYGMALAGTQAISLADPARHIALDALRGQSVHAVAGIGNPARFFTALRRQGLSVIEHPFADHFAFEPQHLRFGDTKPVLMTEKDAVKCRRFATDRHWYVPVQAELDPLFAHRLDELLKRKGYGQEAA